jgi:predicted Zn-dependent protease
VWWGVFPSLGSKKAAPRRWLGRGPKRRLAAAAVLTGLLAAPAHAGDPLRAAETQLAKMVISNDLERRIGLQIKNELERKQGVDYLEDKWVVDYVRAIAARVIDQAKVERPGVQWTVMVINDRKTVNAFATPGGFLYVYRGLLEFANDEAELASIMGHEAGHVVARHGARDMVASYGIDAVTSLALGRNAGLLARLVAGAGVKGLLLEHSREEETESDEYGARYAAAVGYDPHAILRYYSKHLRYEGSSSVLEKFLSDHPETADRFTHMTAYIAEHGLTGEYTNREDYVRMKKYLATVPAGRYVPLR